MLEHLLEYFQGTQLSLWGPFILLLLCGLGLPMPEDIVLIAAGMLGVIDGHSWIKISAFMYAGVLLGDTMIFFAGQRYGTRLLGTAWFQRIFPPLNKHASKNFSPNTGPQASLSADFCRACGPRFFLVQVHLRYRW